MTGSTHYYRTCEITVGECEPKSDGYYAIVEYEGNRLIDHIYGDTITEAVENAQEEIDNYFDREE